MNWEKFVAMGGYAFYVWTAYGLMLAVLVLNLIVPWRRKTEALKRIARQVGQAGDRP